MLSETKIWVVSLADARERRDAFSAAAQPHVSDWEFFDAHRGLTAGNCDEARTRRRIGRTLQPAELGCFSTHKALWQWLATSSYRQMIVLEDDVVADWRLLAAIGAIDFNALQIDYMRLFAKVAPKWQPLAIPFLFHYHHLMRITGFALGTQAYVLTREGAARLLKHCEDVVEPVDVFLDRYWVHGLPNLVLYPFPVFERFQPSSIGEGRFTKAPRSLSTVFWKIHDRLRMSLEAVTPLTPALMETRKRAQILMRSTLVKI